MHSPSSLTSAIPPPPGYLIEGEDVHALLQSYALIPPSQDLELRVMMRPFASKTIDSIARHLDYPQLTTPDGASRHRVLLHVDGPQPTRFAIREAIGVDANERGMGWGLVEGENAIVKVEALAGNENDVRGQEGDAAGGEGEGGLDLRPKLNRFVVSFESDLEAQRFARTWHMRPLPRRRGSYGEGDEPAVVHTELLW